MVVLVSVHKVVGTGLTQEVECLLRHAPMKRWTLREVLSSIRCGAMAGEVNSILYKLERDKRLIDGGKGDQLVKINIAVPKKLSSRQKELLKEFAKLSGDETSGKDFY